MAFILVNHKEVKNDVLSAKVWYKAKSLELENRFSTEIKKTIASIGKNPFLFQVKYLSIRTAFTEIFPYGIHFHVNEKTEIITIVGVFHTSISPNNWKNRL